MRWQSFSTPSRGQQALPPLGSEQTISLPVVLIYVLSGCVQAPISAKTGHPRKDAGPFRRFVSDRADQRLPRENPWRGLYGLEGSWGTSCTRSSPADTSPVRRSSTLQPSWVLQNTKGVFIEQ